MPFDQKLIKNLVHLKDGYLEYKRSDGVFEYFIGLSMVLFDHKFTIASDIDDTQIDFDISPRIRVFNINDDVSSLGTPPEFFSSESRINHLQELKAGTEEKYGLLPIVATIRYHEMHPDISLSECLSLIYKTYVDKIEGLIQDKDNPFS